MYTPNSQSTLNFGDWVESWGPAEVADWLRGLDDCIQPFVHLFVNKNVGGAELFILDEGDLERIGVSSIGARQAIALAVFQLSDLCYALEKKNLQSLAMKLGVQAHNLHNELKYRLDRLGNDANAALGWLPNDILSHVSTLVDDTKEIVNWLDRPPFDSIQDYIDVRNPILSFASTIVQAARQPSSTLTQTARDIQMACTQLSAISDKVVKEFTDPLILQTAYLERAIVRRSNPMEEFGMNIESTADGVHVISEVKFQSPADFAGKIEAGDEIVQACGKTVVAWPLSKLATILNETRLSEAPFIVKKRPRQYYGNQTLGGKAMTPGTPKFKKIRPAAISSFLVPVQTPIQAPPPSQPLPKARRRSSSVSVPRTPVEKVRSTEVKPSPPVSPASPIPFILLPPNEQPIDEEGSTSGPPTRQRRATVSGGSPTLKRLSLHLNRNISVSPRPQTQWFHDEAALNSKRLGDVGDLDMPVVRSKLARPNRDFRASLIGNQLYIVPKGRPFQIRKKRKNSSLGSNFEGGDRFDEFPPTQKQSLDDDVFPDMDILSALVKQAADAMPSDVSEEGKPSESGTDESVLEEAEPDEVPAEAKIINDEEWEMAPNTEEGLLTNGAPPTDEGMKNTRNEGTTYNVHKTRSYPGRDSTAPKPVTNPWCTLPKNSQDKLSKFFGEVPTGSAIFYTEISETEGASASGLSRKSPMQSSQASVASGSTSRFSPRRSKVDLLSGGVGQVLHGPKKHHRHILPTNSNCGSPILTGMRRLTSSRQQQRSTSTVDPTFFEKAYFDNRKKMSEPAKSNLAVADQQLLASLGNEGNLPLATRLKLSCFLPCKSIGVPEFNGWAYRARCPFESVTAKKWHERWLVLKKECLFIYKSEEDHKAEGVLWLPAFRVCQAGPEYHTKRKHVFKLDSTHSAFYFYCYNQKEMYTWIQKLGLAAIGYTSQMNRDGGVESNRSAEFYFAAFDELFSPQEPRQPIQQQVATPSPAGLRRNLLQPDSLFNTLRQSWRRSQLSREDSNESSLSCHSEGAVSASSIGRGSTKVLKVRDPLHVRGGGNEPRSKSAGRMDDDKESG